MTLAERVAALVDIMPVHYTRAELQTRKSGETMPLSQERIDSIIDKTNRRLAGRESRDPDTPYDNRSVEARVRGFDAKHVIIDEISAETAARLIIERNPKD